MKPPAAAFSFPQFCGFAATFEHFRVYDSGVMTHRRVLALLFAAGLVLLPTTVAAAPTPQDRAAAKVSWVRGKRLYAQGKHDDAVAVLREAVDKDAKAQYQLDLARALAKSKSYVEAIAMADAVVSTKEPNTQRAKQAAAALKKDIAPKIPSLRIEVIGASATDVTVWIDGERAEVGEDVQLDPGSHSVKGKAGSAAEVTKQIELVDSEKEIVTLELAPPVASAPKEKEEGAGGGNMAPAAVLYGVGAAGLVVGGVLGVLAYNKTGEVEELCGGSVCPPRYADDVALAQDYGTGSTVAFAVGGLCVAAGIILTVTVGIDHSDEEEVEDVETSFYVGPGSVGFAGRF